ncbi:hypothetical protein IC620_15440 [Hazenella sp. IB182357]|uniref:Uncharacterized protein n=1 Tax=Polycladospora coralii TaxID=2771432 RepID=A0A926RVL6_9BACL|nr:hypothetical protein [Polycladospora coralii]MBD1373739.1 hypothetical protein [Polycladospora coralii]
MSIVFRGRTEIFSLSDVGWVSKGPAFKKSNEILIIFKYTYWDYENEDWANAIGLEEEEAEEFLNRWTEYKERISQEDVSG